MRFLSFRFVLGLALSMGAIGAFAAESGDRRDAEVPPPPPIDERPPATSSTSPGLEPDITITSKGTEIHEEYRYNGQLYRVRVIPQYGAPYYLEYDELGSFRRSDAEPKVLIPQWVIKRF